MQNKSSLEITDKIFFEDNDFDLNKVQSIVSNALENADDGELYLESTKSESFSFDDGRMKNVAYDTTQGFGLRAIADEAKGFAHSGELSEEALNRASETVKSVSKNYSGIMSEAPSHGVNKPLYTSMNPIEGTSFQVKTNLLEEIDAYARSLDTRVVQVSASLSASYQAIQILRANGERSADIRPLVRLNVSLVVEQSGRRETGSSGCGGRGKYEEWINKEKWQSQVKEALRIASTNLESIPTPAGEMPVILGPGWPGVMLHEAVGHGLEGDFNRKGTSIFSGRIGEQVTAKGVTVIDDGTMENKRGSITIDDEGTKSSKNILIEDGILKNYMQDRQNARLMNMKPTGNGRRQSYAHYPMPRMTNTYMDNGNIDPQEIIQSLKKGIYAVNFSGGQVDITNGKFVFSASEAYLVEDGKIKQPLKGATLIGNGPDAMSKISLIGNDLALDDGIGTCGKDGQGVPVGVGQPTLLMGGITIGGTEMN
ncbi:metalloprotease TldD [Alphaproteobacteria bacterium]|jgi:TldD protein|nr:metalloprotease TldD [Alphaproteobacteria bacterium]MDC1209547.1 metalloprotease TldD [Pseudomonadota bacterium]|tara:strand:- start:5806 stop:7254 length:1449 start_codon:yes stop_codon:yes gene_type:complete